MTERPTLHIEPPAYLRDPDLNCVLAALPEARVVGGAVRDALAGRPVADIDLATPDPPERVVETLRAAGIRAVPTGLAHGTVTAVVGGRGFEVTTLRQDVETDGRHAVVAFTTNWRDDAARRDFTINAMSMDPQGGVYDYFGGADDVRAGKVRFVGDPAKRIAEDFLRILRFFRFSARYASAADPETVAAICAGVPGLAGLSVERIWNELRRILLSPNPAPAALLMAETGVLAAILPEGADPQRLSRLMACDAPPDPVLRLAALLTGDAAVAAERLKLSVADRDRLLALRTGPVPVPNATDAELRRLAADTEPLILLDRAWLAGGCTPEWVQLRQRLSDMKRPVFPLEGRDIVACGISPGPAVGNWLRAVRGWWLDAGCLPDATACRTELRRRIARGGSCAADGKSRSY